MHVDYLCGAHFGTERTVGALGVIDDRMVIYHVNGVKFT